MKNKCKAKIYGLYTGILYATPFQLIGIKPEYNAGCATAPAVAAPATASIAFPKLSLPTTPLGAQLAPINISPFAVTASAPAPAPNKVA